MNYTKETLARHEAAHFVMHWPIGAPAAWPIVHDEPHPDVTLGETGGCADTPTPFDRVLVPLAGPVADHWVANDAKMVEQNKEMIEDVVSACRESGSNPEDHDLKSAIKSFLWLGVNILDQELLQPALLLFIGFVREALNKCRAKWDDATRRLIEHGRIGFYGNHPDGGEEAENLFVRWGWNSFDPPAELKADIERFKDECRARGWNVV